MRKGALALAALLVAGCLAGPGKTVTHPLAAMDVAVPDGARLEPIPDGFAVRWDAAGLPFQHTIAVPPHATMVRAVLDGADGARLSMANNETGRRRCNTPTVESFTVAFRSPVSCSSVAFLDQPGALWVVKATGAGTARLSVEFLDSPLDGLLAGLDLALIDPPILALQQTTVQQVPSWDGTPLRVEVTLPVGAGPWPTVIESSPYH
ncbi:MAG: hypothetical protein LC620_02080, partial [Halobacteriales archaeon]|nr:hypothetical protein [Halobacteriales archaeon]